jgi:glycosyltransferase involved in cell wall biosynthesis
MKSIAYVITCKGRLHHLRLTLPHVMAQGASEVIIVDYGCPDRAGDWVEAHFLGAMIVRCNDDPGFNLARARNLGAALAKADWLVFVDADVFVAEGWNTWMQEHLQPGNFYRRGLIIGIRDADTHGTMICARADYAAVGGYDEAYRGWGGEDDDFYACLLLHGVAEQAFPSDFVRAIPHGDDERAGWSGMASRTEASYVASCYRLAKIAFLKELGPGAALPLEIRQIFMENTRRELAKWFAGDPSIPITLNYQMQVGDTLINQTVDVSC